jgi:predicted RNA-binding protein (virulence factor B family)
VLLPKGEIPENAAVGDVLQVFIYQNSEKRAVATLKKPLAVAGELAYLKLTSQTEIGAFLDLGLDRGLFLPFREQAFPLETEQSYLVYVYIDKSGRLCGTTHIYKHLRADAPYQKNDQVHGTVYRVHPKLGIFVAVDDRYLGLIPPTEFFRQVKHGERLEARIIRVREDGKLDLSLRNLAHLQMSADAEKLLRVMQENNGVLPFNEKTAPAEIERRLHMSKAAFKRAVGGLLRAKKIIKLGDQLHLIAFDLE